MSALKKPTELCYVFPQVSLELNVGRYGQTQSTYVLHRLSRTTTLLAFEYLYPPCRAFYSSAQNSLLCHLFGTGKRCGLKIGVIVPSPRRKPNEALNACGKPDCSMAGSFLRQHDAAGGWYRLEHLLLSGLRQFYQRTQECRVYHRMLAPSLPDFPNGGRMGGDIIGKAA